MKTFLTILIACFIVSSVSADTITINDGIINQMFEDFQLDNEKYEIEIISNNLKLQELSEELISIKPLTLKDPLGLFTVIVTILKDNQIIESSQVRMRIKKFDTVLVSTDKLKRHKLLTSSNTTLQRIEITNLRAKPFFLLDETVGYRLKGSVQKGVALTSAMFEKIPDIESGRGTTIVYTGAVFKITADGIALQSGSEGDFIKVKNKTSNKIIVARVIDSHHVVVDP